VSGAPEHMVSPRVFILRAVVLPAAAAPAQSPIDFSFAEYAGGGVARPLWRRRCWRRRFSPNRV